MSAHDEDPDDTDTDTDAEHAAPDPMSPGQRGDPIHPAPVDATLAELVERFRLDNRDGSSSLPGDAGYAP